MNKFNKLKIAMVAVGLATLSPSTIAGTDSGTIMFGTITDVSVSQENAAEFGDNFLLTSGAGISCVLSLEDGSAGNYVGGDNSQTTLLTLTTTRAGNACDLATDAQGVEGGEFLIEGAATAVVSVTVTGATEDDLLFEPAGALFPGSFTSLSNANLDGTTQAFTDGNMSTVTLSTGDDGFGNSLAVGYATILVAGTLTAQAALSAADDLNVNYTVVVTY
jgi:hypothetical protein